MPLRFYFDTHIAKAVADQLRASSIDVIRCEEINMEGAKDADHLMYATRETRIMISQDEDFTILHSHWQKAGRKHAGIMKVPANWPETCWYYEGARKLARRGSNYIADFGPAFLL